MGYDMYWVETPPEAEIATAAAQERFHQAVKIRDAFPKSAQGIRRSPEELQAAGIDVWDAPISETNVGFDPAYAEAQAAVTAAYDDMDVARVNYFRLNISGMQVCRQLMEERGMLCEGDYEGFQSPESFGVTDKDAMWNELEEIDENWGDTKEGVAAVVAHFGEDDPRSKYVVAHFETIAGLAPDRPGIQIHKLCDNSGWLVQPIEIQGALARLKSWADGDDEKMVRASWVWEGVETEVKWWPRWLEWLAGAIDHGGFRVH